MNEKDLQKTEMVYGVPCTCGSLAMIAKRDSGTHKSFYWCACDRRYVRDDLTGEVLEMHPNTAMPRSTAPGKSGTIPLVHLIILPDNLEAHYAERSAATGKEIPDLIIEDLKLSFKQWKRAQSRQESKIFRENESERL